MDRRANKASGRGVRREAASGRGESDGPRLMVCKSDAILAKPETTVERCLVRKQQGPTPAQIDPSPTDGRRNRAKHSLPQSRRRAFPVASTRWHRTERLASCGGGPTPWRRGVKLAADFIGRTRGAGRAGWPARGDSAGETDGLEKIAKFMCAGVKAWERRADDSAWTT